MTTDAFIPNGIAFCLAGTLLSGAAAVCGRGVFTHRASQGILILSNAVGALAALAYLLTGKSSLVLFKLPFLFHTAFMLDGLSAFFLLLVTVVTCLVGIFAIRYVEAHRDAYDIRSLNVTAALFIFGMQAVLLATTIAGFMVFWETMSVASFFLVMTDRKDASMKAAFLYLTMTQLGASALLAGFFLLGNGTMFVDFSMIAEHSTTLSPSMILAAFALLFFGFGSKAGLVPFHLWLPEAHPRAPSHISALMSGIMLKIALYGFLRTTLFVLPPLPATVGFAVLVIGLLSGLFGVLHAVVDRDIKRTLAFSSIENLGLIFTMVGLSMFARAQGLQALAGVALAAGLFHAGNHAIFKSGLFLCAGTIVQTTHEQNLESMGGLAKVMPIFTMAFCILSLAASALPPFGAFFGEWVFLQSIVGTLHGGDPLFVKGVLVMTLAVVVFVSGLAVFAMVKVFAIASLGAPRSPGASRATEPPASANAPVIALAALTVLVSVFSPMAFQRLSPSMMRIAGEPLPVLSIATDSLSPAALLLALLALLIVSVMFTIALGNRRRRACHVWDCGQPVHAGMEYTATAFSAPIRFFFRFLLHHRKTVVAVPVVPTNPWIATRTMTINADSLWFDTLYRWIARLLFWLSTQAKRLQNGVVQFYLFLIFLSLVLSLLLTT